MRIWAAFAGVCVVCVTAACTAGDPAVPVHILAPVAIEVAAAGLATTQVQVIAHPDDDLYFMAPDVQRFIANGWNSTTVVITAGENNGSGSLDREQYAGLRQAGLRAAYAHMAGVDNAWDRVVVTVAGKQMERDTLVARPQVRVVFLNLPDGKDTVAARTMALERLWQGKYQSVLTVVPTGSVLTDVQSYTAAELTTVLIGVLGRATVARILDGHPDHRFPADHTDHIHAARFAELALLSVTAPVAAYAYRGYGSSGLPADLDPVTATAKSETLAIYGTYDPDAGLAGIGSARTRRSYPRYLGATLRAVGRPDGRLSFLAIVSGSVRIWEADAPADPQIVGGPPLAAPLAAVRQADGQLRLFALRLRDSHVVTAVQTGTGLFTGWSDLGNPSPYGPFEVGSPDAVVDPAGRIYLFAKNYSGTVSMRTMAPGSGWTDWKDLDGTGVIESVTATVTANGLVELFAPTTTGIRRWAAPSPGAPPVLVPGLLGSAPAGGLTVVPNPDGGLQIFYRCAGDTTVCSIWRNGDGGWHGPVELVSAPGTGPIAAAIGARGITLVASTPTYHFSTARQAAGSVGFSPRWSTMPGDPGHEAALAVDEAGRSVIGILGADGRLQVRGQGDAVVDSPYGEQVPA
jgi:LmbE family N-acetylglucosaminyl deacetylase